MISLRGLEGRERLRRDYDEGLDFAEHRQAVGLQCEERVAAPGADYRGGVSLDVQRIAGDEHPAEGEGLEHRARGEDLVLAIATALCAMAARAPLPKAVTTWSAERPAARSKERCGVAVDGEHAVAGGAEVVEKRLEGCREARRVEQAEDPA